MAQRVLIRYLFAALTVIGIASAAMATEYHVSVGGNDAGDGSKTNMLRTIMAAARLAQPGDTITVHAGIYRERVSPPRGGKSDAKRIVYQAAPGEKVVIKGSEIVRNWQKVQGDTWKVSLPHKFFGTFNPYADRIHGDWYDSQRVNHTGAVYLKGDWLMEAVGLEDVLKPAGPAPLWYAKVEGADRPVAKTPRADGDRTTIWAQFPGINPNEAEVEINVRPTVFTPERVGIDYITVRGFTLCNAATNWAPPTAGQFGLVSAYWCKGWIIEDNDIGYSTCCGVALGKYSDEWDNRAGSAEGYVGTLTRALKSGWNKATVGSHVVRDNHIHHCEQTGVVGSLGCSFSTVTGNDIHDIHVRRLFGGAEMAGIKFHGAIDAVISRNHIYRCGDVSGIWLDWMGQGAQVTGNLMHDNSGILGDIFLEMQHGPILIANNLLLSPRMSFALNAQGIAVAHNLIVGPITIMRFDTRVTPFQLAHNTELGGMYAAAQGDSGDHRFYNNLFVAPCTLRALDSSVLPCFAAGNIFTKGTAASKFDVAPLLLPIVDPGVKLEQKADGWRLTIHEDAAWRNKAGRKLVTTQVLARARVPKLPYENGDGTQVKIDTDYFGKQRDATNPFPGPFESPPQTEQTIKVWPMGR